MTRKLREYACTLRTGHQNGKSLEELRQEKDAMMATIYNMLCVCLGKPPRPSPWRCATRRRSSSAT